MEPSEWYQAGRLSVRLQGEETSAYRFTGQTAVCELTGAKTYDRVVGYCSIDGQDFGKTMMDKTTCNMGQV